MYINNLLLSRLLSYYEGVWRNPASGGVVTLTLSKYHTHYLLVMVTAQSLQPSLLHKHGLYHQAPLPSTSLHCSVSVCLSSFVFIPSPCSQSWTPLCLFASHCPSSCPPSELACLSHFSIKQSAVWLNDWCTGLGQAKIPQLRRNCKI